MNPPEECSTLPLFSCHAVQVRTATGTALHLPDIELLAGQVLDLDTFGVPIRNGLMQLITARQLPLSGTVRFGGIDAGFWPNEELDHYCTVLKPRAQQRHDGITGCCFSDRAELTLQQALEFTTFVERLQRQHGATRIVVLDGLLDFLDSATRGIALQFLSHHLASNHMAAISCAHEWHLLHARSATVGSSNTHSGQANSSIGMPMTTTRTSIGKPSRQ